MHKRLLIIYLLVVLLLVVLPINGKESRINHIYILSFRLDYIFHLILFCPWMFFLNYIKTYFFKYEITLFKWVLTGLFFCISSECLQYFIPYRAFNINDAFANCLGILCSLCIYLIVSKKIAIENTYH